MHRSKPRNSQAATLLLLLLATLATKKIQAQFDIEDSNTTASLRGIHNVGGGVAWASGTNGTVLRTEDGGYLWQTCTIPPGAEKLDFRGIQAFDENTAIVMSSGKGDLSRLYKTTDGCQTWKLLFTNPDKEGFWDAIQFDLKIGPRQLPTEYSSVILLIGDSCYESSRCSTLRRRRDWDAEIVKVSSSPLGKTQRMPFAASNSSIAHADHDWSCVFGTGGSTTRMFRVDEVASPDWSYSRPLGSHSSISLQFAKRVTVRSFLNLRVPRDTIGTCRSVDCRWRLQRSRPHRGRQLYGIRLILDGLEHWQHAQTPPHGYRSSVAYDPTQKLWITVGPNGTDISRDDGKNWTPLKPSGYDPPDADKNWNALSLPFVVGPHGRIGRLRTITQKPEHPSP